MTPAEWCRVIDPSVNDGRPFAVERAVYDLLYRDQPLELLHGTQVYVLPEDAP